ncbi:GTPase, partial [Sulfolobus sp. B5]
MKKEILIEGPCDIKVTEGEIRIVGIRFERNNLVKIPESKTYTLIFDENTKFEMNCKVLNTDLSLNWDEVAEQISQTGGSVLLLGDIDSGKTYFTNLISNLSVPFIKIIDADVGQSSLFLPTFVSSATPTVTSLDIEYYKYNDLEFFGDITPSTNPRLHVSKILRIYEKEPHQKITVIDTDGWIHGLKAMLHKFELIYSIDPDYIITFDTRIRDILPLNYRNRVKILNKVGLHKDKNRRKISRVLKYKRYFESDAKLVTLSSEDIIGISLSDILYNSWGEYLQLSVESPCLGYYIDSETLKGALVGIIDRGRVIGAAILREISGNYIKLLTKADKFSGVILGYISLNHKFEERR